LVGIMTVLPLPGSINSNRWWETRSSSLKKSILIGSRFSFLGHGKNELILSLVSTRLCQTLAFVHRHGDFLSGGFLCVNLHHCHHCCPSSTSSLSLVLIPRPHPPSSFYFDCCVVVVFVVIVFVVHRPHPPLPHYPRHHFPHHLVPHHSSSSSSSHILVVTVIAVFVVDVASHVLVFF